MNLFTHASRRTVPINNPYRRVPTNAPHQYETTQSNIVNTINSIDKQEGAISSDSPMADQISATLETESLKKKLHHNIKNHYGLSSETAKIEEAIKKREQYLAEWNKELNPHSKQAYYRRFQEQQQKVKELTDEFNTIRRERIHAITDLADRAEIEGYMSELESFESKSMWHTLELEAGYDSFTPNEIYGDIAEISAEETTALLASEAVEGEVTASLLSSATESTLLRTASRGGSALMGIATVGLASYELYKAYENRYAPKPDFTHEQMRDYNPSELVQQYKQKVESEKQGLGFFESAGFDPVSTIGKAISESNERAKKVNAYVDKENRFYSEFKTFVLKDQTPLYPFAKVPTLKKGNETNFLDYWFPYQDQRGMFEGSHSVTTTNFKTTLDKGLNDYRYQQVMNDTNITQAEKKNITKGNFRQYYLKHQRRYFLQDVAMFKKTKEAMFINQQHQKQTNDYLKEQKRLHDQLEHAIRTAEEKRLHKENKVRSPHPHLPHHTNTHPHTKDERRRRTIWDVPQNKPTADEKGDEKIIEDLPPPTWNDNYTTHPPIAKEILINLAEDCQKAYSNTETGNSTLIVNGNAQCRIFYYDSYINVCFRGTEVGLGLSTSWKPETVEDIWTDLDLFPTTLSSRWSLNEAGEDIEVSRGFLDYVLAIYPQVKSFISANSEKAFNLTGHSLGSIACCLFGYIYYLDTGKKPQHFVGFGTPAGIKNRYVDKFDSIFNFLSVNNINDFIPYLSPYSHVGAVLLLDGRGFKVYGKGSILQVETPFFSISGHKLDTYIKNLQGLPEMVSEIDVESEPSTFVIDNEHLIHQKLHDPSTFIDEYDRQYKLSHAPDGSFQVLKDRGMNILGFYLYSGELGNSNIVVF